jgi:maltooligosyltrehalose trehalohydrolase
VPARRLVVFAQNHDQVGNRVQGERLTGMVSLEKQKLAAGLVLLSPFVPLIFMGEEYGETAPFLYFVSHSDPALIEAVRAGRRHEFASFGWQAEAPDPQDEQTFRLSRLNHSLKGELRHQTILAFYRELLALRTRCPALSTLSKRTLTVTCDRDRHLLLVQRRHGDATAFLMFNFSDEPGPARIHLPAGSWRKRIDSARRRWMGPGSNVADRLQTDGPLMVHAAPHSVVVWTTDQVPGT